MTVLKKFLILCSSLLFINTTFADSIFIQNDQGESDANQSCRYQLNVITDTYTFFEIRAPYVDMYPGCDSYDYSNHIDNITYTDSGSTRTYNFSYIGQMFEGTGTFDIQIENTGSTNTGSTNTGSTNTGSTNTGSNNTGSTTGTGDLEGTGGLNFILKNNGSLILNPNVENKLFESTCTLSGSTESCTYNLTRTSIYNVIDSFMFIIFIFLIYKVGKTILLGLVSYLGGRSGLDKYKL